MLHCTQLTLLLNVDFSFAGLASGAQKSVSQNWHLRSSSSHILEFKQSRNFDLLLVVSSISSARVHTVLGGHSCFNMPDSEPSFASILDTKHLTDRVERIEMATEKSITYKLMTRNIVRIDSSSERYVE